MAEPLWIPDAARVARAKLTTFRQRAERSSGEALPDYDALWRWSVERPAAFWALLAQEIDVRWHAPPQAVLHDPVMPGARWFPGATLSFAEHLLRRRGEGTAVIALDERGGPALRLSFDALRVEVARLQGWLRAAGVGPGDRVAAWLPNRAEAVIGMLATTALGAVWTSSSPDFGPDAVLARFSQVGPKVLIAGDGARYAGKEHDLRAGLRVVQERLGGVPTIVVPVLGLPAPEGAVPWAEAQDPTATEPTFTPVPFDHPLYILYSSGTTGAPKCIVHGTGGTLLQHAKEHRLHTDLGEGDVLFFYTTTGWMMWNWLVSALAGGTTIVLWDGSPVHPAPDALWRMAEEHGVTAFGTSPRYLALCEQAGLEPGRDHDLSPLRTLLSTGSPLPDDAFRWVYGHVKADLQLASISGGTDIISCFMLGSPVDPVYAGEIQKRGLGMAVEAWDADGRPVTGERAELVCTRPFPSMPVGFWGDPEGRRYRRAYFEHFRGVWRHGDFIELTERGGVIVHGRSDATLNPGGVRIGTAELYAPVEAMPEVADSVVVGLPKEADVEVLLLFVPAPGVVPDAELAARIRRRVRELASPRHVPARILAVPAIPRTISGKKVEIAVLQALLGETPPNRDALANPEALDWFMANAAALRAAPSL